MRKLDFSKLNHDVVYDNYILDFRICIRSRLRKSDGFKPDVYYVLKTGGDEFYCSSFSEILFELISLLRRLSAFSYHDLVKCGYIRRVINGVRHKCYLMKFKV